MEDLTRRPSTGAPAGIDEADVDAVTECVRSLYGAAGQARLYGPAHPQTLRAVAACHQQILSITSWLGPLVLESSHEGLDWRGHRVMQERDDSEGIGRHLHIEGIAEIAFAPELDPTELSAFLQVARINLSLPEYEEETLESLLFQAELANIGFRAITELMDAESLSGQMDPELLTDAERVKSLLDLQAGDLEVGRHLLAKLNDHRMPGLGDVVDHWGLDAELDLGVLDDDEFKVRFLDDAGEDLTALMEIRNEIANERSSQLLARTVAVLLRVCLQRHEAMPQALAMDLATGAMRQLYVLGDAVGLLQVLEDGHRLANALAPTRPPAAAGIRTFLKRTFSPIRVARMLRHLRADEPLERRTLERFVRLLPDTAVVTFFDGVKREEQPAVYATVVRIVVELVSDRLAGWLKDVSRIPMEQLLPILFALDIADSPVLLSARSSLLQHPSPPVREATLQTFMRRLDASDTQRVIACLVDRSSIVRLAATRVLTHHKPVEAVTMLRSALEDDNLEKLDPDVQVDVCIAFARIGGANAIPMLSAILDKRPGLLAGEAAEAPIRAAALGLAALATPNVVRMLEKGARSLSGAKRRACQDALDAMMSESRR